ncbi:F0F1 ATP synthase subunit A [Cupriavidus numazuensis]|uniref:ATP synthase subunit a n=1 Tax=Cupriavidus numazuensis TaxID=221992 RepID=A0ABM8TMU8_9BURK|nr:F0F1 ATP synthase subunit A [Cupriavidus numazuensis]CAG2155339.1 ATP synthase subunit a [Cupriavidus numazuensis]
MNNVIVWQFHRLAFTEPMLLSLCVSACLVALALALRHAITRDDEGLPLAGEMAYQLMHDAVEEVVGANYVERVLPFVGTLWLFILLANLLGLVPGLLSPTRDLSVTSALAVIVFAAVHVFGIRASGWKAYLRHYLAPTPMLLPFHLISEFTRTIALAIRLFGNMMSLEMAAMLVLLVAGLLVPVPLLLLHVVEALVQAYIFGMLALIYIGSALEAGQPGPLAPSPLEEH